MVFICMPRSLNCVSLMCGLIVFPGAHNLFRNSRTLPKGLFTPVVSKPGVFPPNSWFILYVNTAIAFGHLSDFAKLPLETLKVGLKRFLE